MAATEDENFSFALSHAEKLSRSQVNNCEDDPEGYEDSHITGGMSVSFLDVGKIALTTSTARVMEKTYRHLLEW